MKTYMLATLFLLTTSTAFAFGPIMTASDRSEILKVIDRTCADTWCAGDYEYQFSSFSCNETTATCTLGFKIIDRDDRPGKESVRNRRCIFKNITSKDKIIHDSNLTEEFYDQLNACVSNREFSFN